MYEITQVPIPERHGGGRRCVYPWKQVKIGQSFFVPVPKKSTKTLLQQTLTKGALRHWGKGNYTTRIQTEGDPPQEGVRVWRTG